MTKNPKFKNIRVLKEKKQFRKELADYFEKSVGTNDIKVAQFPKYIMELDLRSGSGEDPKTIPNEWLLERLRKHRNRYLAVCDWTQTIDSPLTDAKKQEWATYRQALRDITSGWTPSETVNFPDEPS